MTPEQLATELLRIREESLRLETREKQLREEMETLLASTPGNRLNVGDHEFSLVPAGTITQLNEDLLREVLTARGLSASEVETVLQAATKTSERSGYLRISGK